MSFCSIIPFKQIETKPDTEYDCYIFLVNIQAKCSLFCSLLNQNTFGFEVVHHLVLGI